MMPTTPSVSSDPSLLKDVDSAKLCLSKPNCIGEFSLDATRRQQLGRSRVRYLYDGVLGKKLSADLAQNLDTFVQKEGEEGIDQILRWILTMAAPNSSLKKTVHECDFVLWRGTLTRLMTSCYDVGSYGVGVKVACTKFKDVCFIREFDTQAKCISESTRSDYLTKICYGGFKFEQMVTVEDPGDKPDTSAPVDQNNEFIGMFKATLSSPRLRRLSDKPQPSSLRLMFGAEIDCISPHGDFMEVKTQFKQLGYGKGFGNKALKWFVQSYLAGIKQIVVGLHENLILNRVELFSVESLPKMASSCQSNNGEQQSWSISVCFAFLFDFLHLVKRTLAELPEGAILVAERLPTSYEFKFAVIGADDPAEKRAEYPILSDEFRAHSWR